MSGPGWPAQLASVTRVTAPRVTLSFDNGPTPGVTEQVLDVLAAQGVPATFFVVGSRLADRAGRQAARRALAEGHRVGGHTWSHRVPFGTADDATVDRELDDTARAVADVGGDPRLFRPYGVGGAIDARLMSAHGATRLCDGGFTCVLWTSVPRDWVDPDGWPDVALAAFEREPWSVVVLHDLPGAAAGRLDAFLRQCRERGAVFTQDTPDACTPVRAGAPTSSYALLGV